jgi:Mu transposase, C-terminal
MFLCELDGYIRRKRHQPNLSLERFEELFRTFLLETYHRRTSVTTRAAPSERWEEGGFLPRMPESLEQLDLLLMQEVRARKVRRDGIHFQGLRYLSLTLAAYVGEDVTIRFDPVTWAKSASFTRIASFARRSQPTWQARPFLSEKSFECATNVAANSARSFTIGNRSSIRFCN